MNQKGVTWKSLFGDYLREAKKIVVTAPFIRLLHQLTKLIELILTFQDTSIHREELEVELHTQDDSDTFKENLVLNLIIISMPCMTAV